MGHTSQHVLQNHPPIWTAAIYPDGPASMGYTSFLVVGMIDSGRLFKFDHLADARLVAHLQPI